MKLLLSSLAILASSVSVAAPVPSSPVAAPQAAVPSAERLALARHFVAVALPPERYMELVRASANSSFVQTVAELSGDDAEERDQAGFDRFFARLEPVIKAQIPTLSEAYAKVYAREYSGEDLQQMIAFAQTPAGQHYLSRRDFVDLDPAVIEAQIEMVKAMTPV